MKCTTMDDAFMAWLSAKYQQHVVLPTSDDAAPILATHEEMAAMAHYSDLKEMQA